MFVKYIFYDSSVSEKIHIQVRAEEETMNPYYQNWNYGYTLGAPTEASRGAYTVYGSQGGGGANPANLATPSCLAHTRQKVINIVDLTVLRLAFFMGYE